MVSFSRRLQKLLGSKGNKRLLKLQDLLDDFAEKGFAILFLLLMAIPALPLPTGGVTHIFEIIVLLLALELIAGRKTVWLPARWRRLTVPAGLRTSALPRFIKIIRWVEKYSRPRLRKVLTAGITDRIMGIVVFSFTAFAFFAPPFSGLDTLPALGVVLLSLAMIFEDAAVAIVGLIAGSVGIALIFLLGKLAFRLI